MKIQCGLSIAVNVSHVAVDVCLCDHGPWLRIAIHGVTVLHYCCVNAMLYAYTIRYNYSIVLGFFCTPTYARHQHIIVKMLLHCVLSLAVQCIVIGPVCLPVCLFVGLFVCLWVCYHDNSKLRASIFSKLGLWMKVVTVSS